MKVLVAPNTFKGSATAIEVCQAVTAGINELDHTIKTRSVPLADGGDGTVDSFVFGTGSAVKTSEVTGPFGQSVQANWTMIDSDTAVMEVAQIGGMAEGHQLDPKIASTIGVGQLLELIAQTGVKTILIGLGGSVTNDGGMGMAQALGVRFFDATGKEIKGAGTNGLAQVAKVDLSQKTTALDSVRVIGLYDVSGPVVG